MLNPKKFTNQGLQDVLSSNSHPTNLIINYLPRDITDEELYDMFSTFGEIRRCKIVRDTRGHSAGYGFVDFVNSREAFVAQILLNEREIRGKRLKVAFAKPPSKDIAKANLFVKHLPPNVDKAELETLFGSYGKIVSVKIVRDLMVTAQTLNVAYVRFEEHMDAQRARNDLDGYLFSRARQPISVQTARGSKRPDSDFEEARAMEEPPFYPSPPPKIQAEVSKRPRGFIFEDSEQETPWVLSPPKKMEAEAPKRPRGFIFEDSDQETPWVPSPPPKIQAEAPKRPCGFIFTDSESD